MEEWIVKQIIEDVGTDEDRWMVVYEVPEKYAPDGIYSHSFPKKTFSYIAAEFGYDPDDPNDRERLFQHVIHRGYLAANDQLGIGSDLDPGRADVATVRRAAASKLTAASRSMRMVRSAQPVVKLATAVAEVPADPLDVIRADMQIDKKLMDRHHGMMQAVRAHRAKEAGAN